METTVVTPTHYMWSQSPTSGLFDTTGLKHEPPDPLDLDLDLLSTVSFSPQTRKSTESIGSNESTNDLMLENWQINEVFQTIPDVLEVPESLLASNIASNDHDDHADLDMLLKCAFPEADLVEPTLPISDKNAVIGQMSCHHDDNAVANDSDLLLADIDLSSVIKETFGDNGLDGFQLLEELEAMEESDESGSVEPESLEAKLAVESDHQYSQLCNIEVKPHETKKQAIRRVKNNAASKVCRKRRKNKFATNTEKISELLQANADLQKNIDSVQNVVDILREHLVKVTRQ
jgi:hypothetical protein